MDEAIATGRAPELARAMNEEPEFTRHYPVESCTRTEVTSRANHCETTRPNFVYTTVFKVDTALLSRP